MQKTKRDKDKAIKIIVQIIGNDRLNSFLNKYAGSPDILDKLLEHFSSSQSNFSFSPQPSPTKTNNSTLKSSNMFSPTRTTSSASSYYGSPTRKPLSARDVSSGNAIITSPLKHPQTYRSRIDEYFRVSINGRDI